MPRVVGLTNSFIIDRELLLPLYTLHYDCTIPLSSSRVQLEALTIFIHPACLGLQL